MRAGERLDEHVVGRGWPDVRTRHEMPPRIGIAGSGRELSSLRWHTATPVILTEPDADLVQRYRSEAARRPRLGQVPLSWAPDEDSARGSELLPAPT